MFEYDRGSIYRICLIHGKVCKEEILYAHFPGGKNFKKQELGDHFYIIPYEFTDQVELTPKWIRAHAEDEHLMQSLKLNLSGYRGVAAKYMPGLAKVVKKLLGKEKGKE